MPARFAMMLVVALTWLRGHAAHAQCEYTVLHTLPLGPVCGSNTYTPSIEAINDEGTVCGGVRAGISCPERPFIWHPGDAALTFLPLPAGMVTARALDLNENEIVVGFGIAPNESSYPCTWEDGAVSLLPMPPGFVAGVAEAINDSGCVAGYLYADSGPRHAFLWIDGVPLDLHQLLAPDFTVSMAVDMSDTGIAVGLAGSAKVNGMRAVAWQGASATILPVPAFVGDMGARAVNNSGDVVGFGAFVPPTGPASARAYLWRSGQIVDLGVLAGFGESVVYDMNDAGEAVGYCNLPPPSRGFVWKAGAISQVIVDGIPPVQQVNAINNAGLLAAGRRVLTAVPRPPYDIDQNCAVNVNDLLEVINNWGATQSPADCTHDGVVDWQDLLLVVVNWS